METYRRVLGNGHPDTLISMANLPFTLRGEGSKQSNFLNGRLLQAADSSPGSSTSLYHFISRSPHNTAARVYGA
jgi:hypothetical protein